MLLSLDEMNVICAENSQIVCVRYSYTNANCADVAQIARNTAQTWQQDRDYRETLSNTVQGKIAEEIFRNFMSAYLPQVNILSYDEIRNDKYKKHAPFDYLAWVGDCQIDQIVKSICIDIAWSRHYVNLSSRTRDLCKSENVKILEVKSTGIADRHKQKCSFNHGDYNNQSKIIALSNVILNDDFLTYPFLCRTAPKSNYSEKDYIERLNSKGLEISNVDEMRRFEKSFQLADAFVRVYIDAAEHIGLILGWIDKDSFYSNAVIKKMPRSGKSESAVYFALPLRKGKNFDTFTDLFNTDV